VLSVPIIALTVRDAADLEKASDDEGEGSADDSADRATTGAESEGPADVEGVFLVRDGTVTFTAVEVGIAGSEYFEVLSGLVVGDSVVAGPYQRIRQLENGDRIRVSEEDRSGEDGSESEGA
jgi:HlyD family secretion protein